jgi:hypothetical protein
MNIMFLVFRVSCLYRFRVFRVSAKRFASQKECVRENPMSSLFQPGEPLCCRYPIVTCCPRQIAAEVY